MHRLLRFAPIAAAFTAAFAPAAYGAKLKVPQQFATIQAAVLAAGVGDVVVVAPDTYFENVSVFAPGITVKGKGAIIDGSGDTCMVLNGADATRVEGLTFEDSGAEPAVFVGVTQDAAIVGCTVRNTFAEGIWVDSSAGVEVRDNRFDHVDGINVLVMADKTVVSGNTVVDPANAVVIKILGAGNVVEDNKITTSSTAIQVGQLGNMDTASNLVSGNVVNGGNGIFCDTTDGNVLVDNVLDGCSFGIEIVDCSQAVVATNRVKSPLQEGIRLAFFSSHCVLDGNKVTRAGTNAFHVLDGCPSMILRKNVAKKAGAIAYWIASDDNLLLKNQAAGSGTFDLQNEGSDNSFIGNSFVPPGA